jgi:hypothetical protein
MGCCVVWGKGEWEWEVAMRVLYAGEDAKWQAFGTGRWK